MGMAVEYPSHMGIAEPVGHRGSAGSAWLRMPSRPPVGDVIVGMAIPFAHRSAGVSGIPIAHGFSKPFAIPETTDPLHMGMP